VEKVGFLAKILKTAKKSDLGILAVPAGGVLHQPLAPGPCAGVGIWSPRMGPPRDPGRDPFGTPPGPWSPETARPGTGPRREGLM